MERTSDAAESPCVPVNPDTLGASPLLPLSKPPLHPLWPSWSLPNVFSAFLYPSVLRGLYNQKIELAGVHRTLSALRSIHSNLCLYSTEDVYYLQVDPRESGRGETLGGQLKEFSGPRVWEQTQRLICPCHTAFPTRARIWSHFSFSPQHLAGARLTTGVQ